MLWSAVSAAAAVDDDAATPDAPSLNTRSFAAAYNDDGATHQ